MIARNGTLMCIKFDGGVSGLWINQDINMLDLFSLSLRPRMYALNKLVNIIYIHLLINL